MAMLTMTAQLKEWGIVLAVVFLCLFVFFLIMYVHTARENAGIIKDLKKERDEAIKKCEKAVDECATASELSLNLSNEIATPVNAIKAMVNLLNKEEVSPQVKEYCAVLKTSANTLARTMGDVSGAAIVDFDDEEESEYVKIQIPDSRILIVDDNRVNLTVSQALLKSFGCEVVAADNAYEAVELTKNGERFDLIFMDHLMPGMDGIMATKKIHEIEGTEHSTPIIALTGNTGGGIEENFFKAGMCDFLSKPMVLKQLNAVLKKWIPKGKQFVRKDPNEDVLTYSVVYSPRDFIGDYWNDVELYKAVLNYFLDDSKVVLERLNQSADRQALDCLERFAKISWSVRATKLHSLTNDAILAYKSANRSAYSEKMSLVMDEYNIVIDAIRLYLGMA